MSVKKYIRDVLPKSWETALLEKKCLGKFIEQLYQGIAEPKNKNKYHYKVTMIRARHLIKHKSISYIAESLKFKEPISFWIEVNDLVSTYESQWK